MNGEGGPLDERLARLRAAVDAAASIGLEAEGARTRTVARRVARRAGFGGAVYVMALAGGTGVGKSSVLNALAGEEVSPAKSVRPTTDAPVAWVPADKRDEPRQHRRSRGTAAHMGSGRTAHHQRRRRQPASRSLLPDRVGDLIDA